MAKRRRGRGPKKGPAATKQGSSANAPEAARGPSCSACGAPLATGEKFCRRCGAAVALKKKPVSDESPAKETADKPTEAVPSASVVAATEKPETKSEAKTEPNPGKSPAASSDSRPWRKFAFAGAIVVVVLVAAAVIVLNSTGSSGSAANEADIYDQLDDPVTTTTSTAATSNVDNGKLPNQSRAAMQKSIKKVIRRHHQLIADGNYAAAYSLYSRRKQNHPLYEEPGCQSYSCWAPAMTPLQSGLTNPVTASVRVVRTFKRSGVAEIHAVLPMPSCPTGAWEGITWAKYEGGRWTYDPGWKTDEWERRQYKSTNNGNTQNPQLLGIGCDN